MDLEVSSFLISEQTISGKITSPGIPLTFDRANQPQVFDELGMDVPYLQVHLPALDTAQGTGSFGAVKAYLSQVDLNEKDKKK